QARGAANQVGSQGMGTPKKSRPIPCLAAPLALWVVVWGLCGVEGTAVTFPISTAAAMQGQKAAPVLACPYEWVGYRNVCYYLLGQQRQGSWDWSQEQCSTHRASLAMVTRDCEVVNFLRALKGSADSWLGLPATGQSPSVWQSWPYICSKPLAVGAAPEKGDRERTFSVLGTGGSSH
uniref:C-type lectin domain-containing protein n=1 Tax=Anas platyrhynchos platyrhynchos TaxID=8840 RepID=A0A493TEH1_ANAPP